MTAAKPQNHALVRLLRAYELLAGTCDDERALIGRVSRRWIGAESEHMVRLIDLPRAALLSPRGREILAAELYDDPDLGPEDVGPETLRHLAAAGSVQINSNRLPKLEPTINAAVLAGAILCGVQLYGAGGRGRDEIDDDLILAALLEGAIGKANRFTAFDPKRWQILDLDRIESLFDATTAGLAETLHRSVHDFQDLIDAGVTPHLEIPPAIANAVAALLAARLRLSARAAGDQIFSHLSEAQKAECRAAGLSFDGAFPERPYLLRDYRRAVAALGLQGVDRFALREPIGNTLILAVEDVLEDASKTARLVGRRGKAVHEVHLNLPLMEYYNAVEAPDRLPTIHLAALEMMRYLDKCRRKSFTTMPGHAFQITGILEQTLGQSLDPSIAAAALLHDVAEDGAREVAGYDQSLNKLRLRFGGPTAAMVSEVTDSGSDLDGPRKARTTCEHPFLVLPKRQYDVSRFTEMQLRPTDADTPYTLAGIVIKLADTIASEDEGLRDPDLMSGWWDHSGIRIYWAQRVRGPIVAPLQLRLAEEIERARSQADYARSPTALRSSLLAGLRRLLLLALDSHDLYASQNLLILGDEFGLDDAEQAALNAAFYDPALNHAAFTDQIIDRLLADQRLLPALAETDRARIALYRKTVGRPRDPQLLIDYRESALQRRHLRQRIGSSPAYARRQLASMREVARHYRRLGAAAAQAGSLRPGAGPDESRRS